MIYRDFLEPQLVKAFEWGVENVIGNKQPLGIIIDGSPGMSKTTTAALIARFFQENFDVEKQIGRGIDQFIKSYNYTIDNAKPFSFRLNGKVFKLKVCVYDEANDSDKAGSRGRVQRVLNNVLVATSRQDAVIVIVVLHRFYRLDERFFDNSLVDLLINIDAKVNDKYSHFRGYGIDGMIWMRSMIARGKIIKKPKVYGSSSPNLKGRIKAPPLEFMEEVEKFSKAGKDSLRKKGTKEILSQSYYTVPVLAALLGSTKSAVEYRIKKLNLKSLYLKDKVGKVLFFDKDIFGVLKKVLSKEEDDLVKLRSKS